MTKSDKELIDYLGECFKISAQEFDSNGFLVYLLLNMYKKYGDEFVAMMKQRVYGE